MTRLAASAPVSALIKVCALDTPYLEVTVPHMLRQARYAFAERLLIADPRSAFSGKYARRAAPSMRAFRDALARLCENGTVDDVVWAEPSRGAVADVLARYFDGRIDEAWSHDVTGAPVYAALLGLEVARHERVLLMDADMFFHASGPSWVEAGVEKLAAAPEIWFVMTHAGPPAGALGTSDSLDPRNRGQGVWLPEHAVWGFRHATSRYFLTDRRRLRGTLPAVREATGLATLERCFSLALRCSGAYRVNLALAGSWDLHIEDHRAPFPAWAQSIANLVERGLVPRQQIGNYDLDLRRAAQRIPWRALIEREVVDFNPLNMTSARSWTWGTGGRKLRP